MKPYQVPACKGDSCNGGRKPCETEAICTAWLHRFPLPITTEGPATVEFEERRERPITEQNDTLATVKDYAVALFLAVGSMALLGGGIVACAYFMRDHWPRLVAMLS